MKQAIRWGMEETPLFYRRGMEETLFIEGDLGESPQTHPPRSRRERIVEETLEGHGGNTIIEGDLGETPQTPPPRRHLETVL